MKFFEKEGMKIGYKSILLLEHLWVGISCDSARFARHGKIIGSFSLQLSHFAVDYSSLVCKTFFICHIPQYLYIYQAGALVGGIRVNFYTSMLNKMTSKSMDKKRNKCLFTGFVYLPYPRHQVYLKGLNLKYFIAMIAQNS